MKRIIAILLISILTFGLTACQETPESPIVAGKDIDNMIDKAAENPVVVATDSGNDLRAPLEVPERLSLDAKGQKGNLSIHIDADVLVPNTASMPVARVTKGQFSEEDVKNLYNALIGAGKSIRTDSLPPGETYLRQIQELREMQNNGGEKDGKYMSEEEINSAIEALMQQAASAPDSYEYAAPDFSFKENKDEFAGPLGLYARLCFTPDDKTISEINIAQDVYGSNSGACAEYVRDKYSVDPTEPAQLTVSQEDAKRLVLDTITQLGLSDFVCTGERASTTGDMLFHSGQPGGDRKLYEFMFTRTINNAPITYTDDEGNTTEHEAYHSPWIYEQIRIWVDDKGVFGLQWNSPYIVKEIVSDASAMLAFSDIQGILTRMLPIKYDYMDTDEFYSYEMNITEIRLGLMRITEKNVGDSGLVIPVWDVFGTLTLTGKPGKPKPEEGTKSFAYTSFITINAIDGSIIDRELGY